MTVENLKQNFEKHAHTYDLFSVVQKETADELLRLLWKCTDRFDRIYEAGCGTGLFSRKLLEKYEPSQMTLNDISANMLSVCSAKLAGFKKIMLIYEEGDFEKCVFQNKYDLVASNAVFQWCRNLKKDFRNIHSGLNDGGVLAFAMFIDGTFKEMDESFRLAYGKQKHKKHILDFHGEQELKKWLEEAGYRVREYFVKDHVTYHRHPMDFLKGLKSIGAMISGKEKVSYAVMRRMMNIYMEQFGEKKRGIPATYRTLYCVAVKE